MNNDPIHPEQEISLSLQDRIDILFHEIEMAVKWDRPSILFAIYSSDPIRDEVMRRLKEKFSNISQNTFDIKTNDKNKFDFLSQIPHFPDLSQNVLLIDGFNWECGEEGINVFREFNKHREYFIDNNIRAIFWLYENEVSDFAANATECWLLRHRVVEFLDAPAQDRESVRPGKTKMKAVRNAPVGKSMTDKVSKMKSIGANPEKESQSHANALLSLGIIFWRQGHLSRALKYLRASNKMSLSLGNPTLQVQCQNALALVHAEMGKIDDAVAAYKSAISLSPESSILWNNLGQLLAKNGRNEEAIEAYKNALTSTPQDHSSWDGVGHLFNKLGKFENAISAFEKALEIAPQHEFSWAGLGRAHFESGEFDKAETALRKAVEINGSVIEAWIDLGKCLIQQKRDLDAISIFNQASELNPQNVEILDELGQLYLLRQNYADSISIFQKAISKNPHYGGVYIRLAEALFNMGDFENSASVYQEGIPLFDNTAIRSDLWVRLGDTYLQLKDYEKAISAYEQSDQFQNKKIQPLEGGALPEDENQSNNPNGNPETEPKPTENDRGENMNDASQVFDLKTAAEWNEHGNLQLKTGAFDDAIVAYTKAIELAPDTCWPYIQNLAYVHYQKGKARGKLTAGVIEDPDLWEGEPDSVTISMVNLTSSSPEPGESSEEPGLEKPFSDQPIDPPPATTGPENLSSDGFQPLEGDFILEEGIVPLAEEKSASIWTGHKTEKEMDLQKGSLEEEAPSRKNVLPNILGNTPQNSIDWNELGNTYTNAKKFDNAIQAFKKAIEMNPKYGQPYSNLGLTYYRLGKYEVAVHLYKKSLELLDKQEDKVVSWNRLGDAYRRLGDYGNALSAYQNASEMMPVVNPVITRGRATLLDNFVTS